MKVFLDTNILIDFIARRDGFYEYAANIINLGIRGEVKLYIKNQLSRGHHQYEAVPAFLMAKTSDDTGKVGNETAVAGNETAVPACGTAIPMSGTAVAGEKSYGFCQKWYSFSESGTAFRKVVPLFRVLVVAANGNSCPRDGIS